MAEGLRQLAYPLIRTASELWLLHYLVYGFCGRRSALTGEKKDAAGRDAVRTGLRSLRLLALYGLGTVLRGFEQGGIGSAGSNSYMGLLAMAGFFYLTLVLWLEINARLAVFYTVVFAIPADLCDLTVFMFLMRVLGISVSRRLTEPGMMLLYVGASFVLRFLVLTVVRRFLDGDRRRTPENAQLFLITLSVFPFLYMRNLGFWLPVGAGDIGFSTVVFLAVTGVITLILVIGNERIVYYHIQRNELLKMQNMVRRQQEQYEMRKEAVAQVNQKYHDMRHQLTAILGMEDVGQIHGYVNGLRQELAPLESLLRTGNPLFDVILSGKAEECEKKKIRLLPMVDGGALSMLSAADLCTIFGNALDNAIEGCEKVPEENRRVITLKVCRRQGFLVIRVENPYSVPPRVEAGRLLTTKKDAENHGYGLRGIRQAVGRYGGEVDTQMEEGMFTLTALLPLQSQSE